VLTDRYPAHGSLRDICKLPVSKLGRARRVQSSLPHKTSIEKALAVLLAFNGPARTRGLSDLARELDLPRATLHRILKQLANWGFVNQLPSNHYQLGLGLFELGALVYHHMPLRHAATPHMHSLFHRTRCSVYLTILAGEEAMPLECITAQQKPAIPVRVGSRWSVHCAAAGKVLLAGAPKSELDAYLSLPLKACTEYSITDTMALTTHLEEVRRLGFATAIEESLTGVYSIASPVKDRSGTVIAAVCIASRNQSAVQFSEQVKQVAADISRELAEP
jgi:IclR family transcriptional regulator, acetate operon repressor